MTNWEISRILLDVKQLLLLTGNHKRAAMYEKSAYSIAAIDYSIKSCDDVYFLPEEVSNSVCEILTEGSLSFRKELKAQFPKGIIMLLNLPGLRPEDVIRLYNTLGITSISDLSRALEKQEIRSKGEFGLRFEEQLRRSIMAYNKDNCTLSLFDGFSYANSIKRLLVDSGIKRVEVAGSIRRGKERVNNLNFVVSGEKVKEIIKRNVSFKKIEKETEYLLYLKDYNNIRIRFFIVPEEYFSAALMYYTGSKLHNKKIREIARIKGFNVFPQGFIGIKASSEKAIYKMLGLQYIPPEIREGEEEIELAERNALPKLVDYSDIKGDLHIHSNFSDGTNSISEIKEEAIYHNYRYIAITDHSESLQIANGVTRSRLLKEMSIIDRINKEKEIRILKGSEIEIDNNGNLDFEDDILEKLDIRIAAMHSGFDNDSSANTNRLKKALSNRFVNVLAHPVGRLVSLRDGFKFDVDNLFKLAKDNNVALEINVFPKRMDLPVSLIKQAKRSGVKFFSVGTDAHNVGHLNFMKYGVKILRKAYLTKDEVINTFDLEDLERFLWKRKR
jgi:DNA polymerase (family 10)